MEQKENIFKLLSGNSNLRSCKRETFELLVDSLQNSNVGFSRCIITICASEGKNNTVKQKTNVKMKYQKYIYINIYIYIHVCLVQNNVWMDGAC